MKHSNKIKRKRSLKIFYQSIPRCPQTLKTGNRRLSLHNTGDRAVKIKTTSSSAVMATAIAADSTKCLVKCTIGLFRRREETHNKRQGSGIRISNSKKTSSNRAFKETGNRT